MSTTLRSRATAILAANDLGGWTRPAPKVYPHQWLWDSCFIAIGLSRTDPARAATELRSLARGQWQNGLMPHMIYSRQFPYWLEALLWDTGNFITRRHVRTSGLTQPPMFAIAAEKVVHALPEAERSAFIREVLPTALKFHTWIYRERDPKRTGLAALVHPWECGLDDTPYWTGLMEQLPRLPWSWRWLREFRQVNPDERTTPENLQRMLALVRIVKHYHYDSAKILKRSPVVIQDLVFNAILAAANEALERLAEAIDQPIPAELRQRFAPTRSALEQLWGGDQYYSRDYHSGKLIVEPTVATFMPLYAGTASPARAKQLLDLLESSRYATPHPVPSVPHTSLYFEPQRYWRGPTWISTNWFIIQGLHRYGFTSAADRLRRQTLELVSRAGFREYFNPLTSEGLGADQFSWTAALTLDLLASSK